MKSRAFFRTLLARYPRLLAWNTFLLGATSLLDAAALISVAPIVDYLIHPDLDGAGPVTQKCIGLMADAGIPVSLGMLLALFLFLNLFKSVLQICATHMILRTKYAVLRDIMIGAFSDFFDAGWYFFSDTGQGKLINTFTREIRRVGDAFGAMSRFFASLLQMVVFLVVPFFISWRVMGISMLATCVLATPLVLLGRLNYSLGKQNTRTSNRMAGVLHESLGAAKVILGFAHQDKNTLALERAFDAHRKATLKAQTLEMSIPHAYYPLGLVVLIVTLLAAKQAALPLSEISILIYALFRMTPIVGQILGQKSAMAHFFPSYEQIAQLRDKAGQMRQPTGSRIFTGLSNEIRIYDLTFAHAGRTPTLIRVNVRIPKGRMIAFVGESGAGKSTLLDMIMGFYAPLSGHISVDGIPLGDLDILSFRKRIGYVPQDSVLFNMSIVDNLRWANEKAADEDIIEACRLANADEFIRNLPDGYNTIVGDRGVRLSGGQVQRTALARALLSEPDILFLDEATSALDSRSERLIQEAMEAIAGKTTVVVVAHRLSTIANVDRIYVLKDGRIIEEGNYGELVKQGGEFARMSRLQALVA